MTDTALSRRALQGREEGGHMTQATSPKAIIDFDRLGVRMYRGVSGQRYREVYRDSSVVQLDPEYPVRGERTMTIPVKLFQKFFVEIM